MILGIFIEMLAKQTINSNWQLLISTTSQAIAIAD